MSLFVPYVTIGAHHRGPHVDALYALAERFGWQVLVVDTCCAAPRAPALPPSYRIPYAGMDRRGGAHRRHGWGEAR